MHHVSSLNAKFKKYRQQFIRRLTRCFFIFLVLLILFPAMPAFSDDDDMLLYIPAIIAGSAGWRNTTLSHPIPMTYDGYDDEIRQCRIVQVDDGYWIAYAQYGDEYLYLLKTNLEGRSIIPPFLLATLTRADDASDSYRFTLVPRADGGVQVLTTEKDDGSTSKPTILHDYLFDRHGKIIRSLSVMKERERYNQGFKSLWASRTADGRTIFVAGSDGAIWAGVYTDSGEAISWEVEPKAPSYPDYFDAYYDESIDRLYVLHSNFYDPGYTRMTRWDQNGTCDKNVDLSSEFGAIGRGEAYQLLDTPEGLLVSLPSYAGDDFYRFFLLNKDCTVKRQVEMNGFIVQVADDGDGYSQHAVILDDRNVVRLVWPNASPRRSYYAAFNLDGKLLIPPMAVSQEGKYTALHSHIFVNGRRTTFFYSVAESLYQRLYCRHMAYDFPEGQPDLVVSVPHVAQSPDFATLGAGIAFRINVFNRGEAPSTATNLTLTYDESLHALPVGALQPGESQELDFLDIPTPAYLTALPIVTLDLAIGYWTGNDHVETMTRYPGRTPIYPAGSEAYTWTVRDMDTHAPIEYAQVITTLPNIQTADGAVKDVALIYETDSNGDITTRLPGGTYIFEVSRHGYPQENPERTVPNPSSPYFELEPPVTVTFSFKDNISNSLLHPTPNHVRVDLASTVEDYQYNAQGNENGLQLDEVWRGTYNYSVKAFGYMEKTGQLTFGSGSGANNSPEISLTPTDRGSLTGDTSPSYADVGIEGTVLGTASDASGDFAINDIPYGTYRVVCSKDGYAPDAKQLTINSPTKDMGAFSLIAITQADDLLGHWTESAWNRIDEVPGTFWNPNYKVTTSFGVFDFSGSISYATTGSAADFYSVYLEIDGRKWYYYSVSTSFSLTDIAFSGLDEIVDGAGDLASLIVDEFDGGFFDFLDLNVGGGGSGGSTMVRVDSVCLYDGETDTVLYDSHDTWRQDFSFNGPMGYALGSVHTDNIHNVTLRIYLKVMNQDFCIGPLYLMDKFMMEWRYDDDHFELKEVIQNPAGYPSFFD